jgi:ParB-like chromosome segregation protein Spo0J
MNPSPSPYAGLPVICLGGRHFTILFPDLTRDLSPQERQNLRDSLNEHGMLFPVLIDEEDNIIDGANRLRVASELGWSLDRIRCKVVGPDDLSNLALENDPPLPSVSRLPLTLEQKRRIAVDVNLARRHLKPDEQEALRQKRIHREVELRRQGIPLRAISAEVGVSEKQVRKDLETFADRSAMPERVRTSDGRTYPAQRESQNGREEQDTETEDGTALANQDTPAPTETLPVVQAQQAPKLRKPVKWKTGKQRMQHLRQFQRQVNNLWARYSNLFQTEAKEYGLIQDLLSLLEAGQNQTVSTNGSDARSDENQLTCDETEQATTTKTVGAA